MPIFFWVFCILKTTSPTTIGFPLIITILLFVQGKQINNFFPVLCMYHDVSSQKTTSSEPFQKQIFYISNISQPSFSKEL